MANKYLLTKNGEKSYKTSLRTGSFPVSVRGMGFMYLSPQSLKTFTVLKKDIQSLIWDLLVTTSVLCGLPLVHQDQLMIQCLSIVLISS